MRGRPTFGELARYAGVFARFPSALRRFVADPLTLDGARTIVGRQLAGREASLLRLLRESVYGNPSSPYLPLLRHAGYDLADAEALVAEKGVEGALAVLREAGVYVTYEEFKGRRPIERAGRVFPVGAAAFDNPQARRELTLSTGGSTGQANLVYQDLDHIAALAANELIGLDAHGIHAEMPTVHWANILPGSGIRFVLQRVRHGRRRQVWFTPIGWQDTRAWRKYAAATRYMLWWMRRFGVEVTDPDVVRPDDAVIVARAVRDALDREGSCLLYTSVSRAVRVSLAAQAAGFGLDGATMRLASEPLTPSRRDRIEESGARALAGYGSIETGVIALGCADPERADDVHLLSDAFALVDHPHTVPGTGAVVLAFNLTSLRASTPKVMLNYEIDDHGTVEHRTCGCALGAFGYGTHLHSIRSYTKLVGEGGTLVGEDLLTLLEDVLPRRFGGTALDYQLSEEEDEAGLTRLVLVVDPRVALPADEQVVAFVLGELSASSPMADATATIWRSADTLRVARRAPLLTAHGKFQSLHAGRSR